MPVKMPATHSWTKRPREALLQLDIELFSSMFRIGGRPMLRIGSRKSIEAAIALQLLAQNNAENFFCVVPRYET